MYFVDLPDRTEPGGSTGKRFGFQVVDTRNQYGIDVVLRLPSFIFGAFTPLEQTGIEPVLPSRTRKVGVHTPLIRIERTDG